MIGKIFLIAFIGATHSILREERAEGSYPYIFGTAISTRGIANANGDEGVAGSQTTNWGLDDVSHSSAYANGTNESSANTNGQSMFTPEIHGANTNAAAVNNGEGNAMVDSWSKSFTPYAKYYKKYYKHYIRYLKRLNKKNAKWAKIQAKRDADRYYADYTETQKVPVKMIKNIDNYKKGWPIGQVTVDHQSSRASGYKSAATSGSGTYNYGGLTFSVGQTNGFAKKGWALSKNSDYGQANLNFANSNTQAGAYGKNAQTNANSNYHVAGGAVSNNGQAWGQAQGKGAISFSDTDANNHGFSATVGGTDTYARGDKAVSKSCLLYTSPSPRDRG